MKTRHNLILPLLVAGGLLVMQAAGVALSDEIEKVELLGRTESLAFTRDAVGLKIRLPASQTGDDACAFRSTGLKL
jgi:hypothetical protein